MNACRVSLPAQVRVQGEDLLELVHDQHQPRGAVTGRRRLLIAAGSGGQHRRPDGQVRLVRVPGQPVADRQGVRAADRGQPGGQLGERVLGRRHDDTGPPVRSRDLLAPGQDRQQPGPQQRRLARPRRPGDHHQPAVGRPGGQLRRQLGGQPLPPVEHLRIGLAERQQPPVRAPARPPRDLVTRARRPAFPGRQHVLGRTAATGRRHEQLPHRPGQAQRIGQQLGGVLAGGAVDAPLQVTDRPRAQLRRFGQLLLGQPRLGPQLPQQPAETQRSLLRHARHPPQARTRPQSGTARRTYPTIIPARPSRPRPATQSQPGTGRPAVPGAGHREHRQPPGSALAPQGTAISAPRPVPDCTCAPVPVEGTGLTCPSRP